jgi:hypothetical protein
MARSEKLVIYGEQGIGDELLFAFVHPGRTVQALRQRHHRDHAPACWRDVSRSFPQAKVYGTRYEDEPRIGWRYEKPTCRSVDGPACLGGSVSRNGDVPRDAVHQD